MNKKYISVALATVAGIATVVPVFAQTNTPTSRSQGMMRGNYQKNEAWGKNQNDGTKRPMMVRPVAVGKVTTISGSIITITEQGRRDDSNTTNTQTTLTIDATKATILKNNATSSLSAIIAGDNLFVEGTKTGTNVVATVIHDGVGPRGGVGMMNGNNQNQIAPQMQGNGQPVIAGNVSAINGTSLTVTNKSNITYTVDISNAKVTAKNIASTPASIVTGDMVIVQGAVNGTSVTATTVIDNGVQKMITPPTSGQPNTPKNDTEGSHGIFGGLGSFFSRIFGF